MFIAITFPIAFLTTTARQSRKTLAWTDIALALIAFAVAMYYIVENDRFLNWSRGFSRPSVLDYTAGFTLIVLVVELCRRCLSLVLVRRRLRICQGLLQL